MMVRTSRGRAVVVAALALVVTVSEGLGTWARADEPTSGEKEARRLFQRAELSFNVGKFSEALVDYQAAYQAKPLPGFLFNIAQCYRNMGDQERARFFFRRYLALEPRAPNKRRVEELIDEMTKQLEAREAAAAQAPAAASPSNAGEPPAAPVTPLPSASPPAEPAAAPAPSSAPAPVAEAPAAESPPMVATVAAAPEGRPVWKRWWFWVGAVALVGTLAATTYVLTNPEERAPGSLSPIDGRR
jgi:hypothetical protein